MTQPLNKWQIPKVAFEYWFQEHFFNFEWSLGPNIRYMSAYLTFISDEFTDPYTMDRSAWNFWASYGYYLGKFVEGVLWNPFMDNVNRIATYQFGFELNITQNNFRSPFDFLNCVVIVLGDQQIWCPAFYAFFEPTPNQIGRKITIASPFAVAQYNTPPLPPIQIGQG